MFNNGLSSPRGLVENQSGRETSPALIGEPLQPDYALPFIHYLLIPPGTTSSNPVEYTMQLPIGMVRRLWVEFPDGCAGLAGVQIWRRVNQIFPYPEGVWFRSDNFTVNFAFTHSVHNEPYEVILRGYNEDDTYSHTIWIALEMTGLSKDLPPQLQGLIEYISKG